MFIHSDNKLYIETRDFEDAKYALQNVNPKKTNENVRQAVAQKSKAIAACKLPGMGKTNFFLFDDMRNGWRECIEQHFGNPFDYVAKAPILALVQKDFKAEAFYLDYRYGMNQCLPFEAINKYTNEASWLNMLLYAKANERKVIKQGLNISLITFYEQVKDLLKIEIAKGTISGKFPTNYQRLLEKMAAYKAGAYASLIHPAFNNQNSAKVKRDDASENKLLEILEHPNQYDDVLVAYLYNQWAIANDYKPITSGAVAKWRHKREAEIMIGREGSSAFNEKYIKQVKRIAPTKVGMLWESDDYNLNYYFANPSFDGANKDMHRYVSYIVADSNTGLVLGKSYRQAKSPTIDMVRLAYIDAMHYVRNLVNDGNWYLPFEIKTDHWQAKTLFPFFESIANFVPPAHGNKHRGYIEQLFGSPHAKRAEKLAAHKELNYNGNNVTATNWGVNVEALNNYKKQRPIVGTQADEQVERFFHYMRNMPSITRNDMQAPSREQQWVTNWNTLSQEQKRPISHLQYLHLFGIKHEPKGKGIRITNRGVEPQIAGTKYSYDLPDNINSLYIIGSEVNVFYDPYDMSRVLITDGDKIRCIATAANFQAAALADAEVGSREALNRLLADKKEQVAYVSNKSAQRANYFDEEAIMLGHFMPKELKNSFEPATLTLPSYTQEDEPDDFDLQSTILNR